MEFTPEKKREIEQQIVDLCVGALDQGALTEDKIGEISRFVLANIDTIKTQQELLVFLESMASKWSLFESLLEIEKGKVTVMNDKKAAEEMEEFVKKGDIASALTVAKNNEKGEVTQ